MNIGQQQIECKKKIVWAVEKLGYTIDSDHVEKIALILVQTMAGKWRHFHTLDHILMVGDSDEPLEVLAALFHDWVYAQVDEKINFNLSHYLTPYIQEEQTFLFKIKNNFSFKEDLVFNVVCSIFGFEPNQILSPNQGQNEFLSALAAAKILENILPISLLARITTIIEATIPFRQLSKDNLTAIEILYQRLQKTNQEYNLGLSSEEMEETMKQSVRLANRDVSGFAFENPSDFLDNTWILLPETNHSLINPSTYTIQDYRLAIQKMEAFLYFLKPEFIFSKFKNEPDKETYLSYIENAKHNIATGRIYSTSKLVSICLLEAISLRLDQDIPLVAMFGNYIKNKEVIDYLDLMKLFVLDKKPIVINNESEKEALKLLYQGRIKSLAFDTRKSRITNFLVSKLGFEKIMNLREISLNFLNDKISGEEFINHFDSDLVNVIIDNLIILMQKRVTVLKAPIQNSNQTIN